MHLMWLFVFQTQVGVTGTIYPQRPGQIECDVRTDIIIHLPPISIGGTLHLFVLFRCLGQFSIRWKILGAKGSVVVE
jgi:hypothetical protein